MNMSVSYSIMNAFLLKGKHNSKRTPFDALEIHLKESRGVNEILSFLCCLTNLAL